MKAPKQTVQRQAATAVARRRPAAAPSRTRPARPPSPLLALQQVLGNAYVRRAVADATIQRHCGCGGACCTNPVAAASEIVQRKPAGSPLPVTTRTAMEAGFGRDFSAVRVHTGAQAESWAGRLGARAFTSGNDVFFGKGEYRPSSRGGQALIAHELAHVAQQRAGKAPAAGIDTPGDAFEREADAAAAAYLRGEPVQLRLAGGAAVQRACPVFLVPPEKGGDAEVQSRYKEQRDGPGLFVRGGTRSTPTDTLRRRWLIKKGHEAEYDSLKDEGNWPRDNENKACTVDHIVEWILHGKNPGDSEAPKNMRLLAGRRNSAAGSKVKQQIEALPGNCQSFSDFKIDPSPEDPDECMLIEAGFEQWLQARGSGLAQGATGVFVVLKFAGAQIPLDLTNATGGAVAEGTHYHVPAEVALRAGKKGEVTKGLVWDTIDITLSSGVIAKAGTIDARLLDDVAQPLKGKVTPIQLGIQTDGTVTLDKQKYAVEFGGLSETIFDFSTVDGSVEGRAELRPSKPILNKTIVVLVVKDGELSAKVQVPAPQLNLPVPGLTLGGEGLTIGFEKGQFFASGQITLQYGTVVRGELRADATKAGFSASGTIDLTIPGIDKAQGKVWIDTEGKVGGSIVVGADKLKVPGVKSARLSVQIQDGALSGEGVADLAIPGVKQARLGFGVDKDGNYAISGGADLSIPGTRDASIALTYRDGELEGSGHIGFAIPGLESATIEAKYAKGVFTAAGAISYKKGKLAGTVNVALSERGRISGSGELAYEIAPGLVAFVGMQIREDGTTKISGGLRVPETIELFGRKEIEKQLFKLPTIEIPILAIPLGTRSVGIVATIDARLVARAGVGPGQLRKVKLIADFDPSAAESAFSFEAAAELYVPASAELAVVIAGGIGVSLAIVRAVGGIEAEGAAGLQAEFIAAADLKYAAGQFAVSGLAELSAQPKLIFRLKAFVRVEADIFITTIEIYSKEWTLAQVEAGAALKIGVRIPFKYVFGEPFELSLDQIEFIVPQIDAPSLIKELLPA